MTFLRVEDRNGVVLWPTYQSHPMQGSGIAFLGSNCQMFTDFGWTNQATL